MDSISGFTGQPHSLDPNPQPEAVNMADDAVEGRHKCPQCGKSYTKNWRLVEHIRSHTGEVRKLFWKRCKSRQRLMETLLKGALDRIHVPLRHHA